MRNQRSFTSFMFFIFAMFIALAFCSGPALAGQGDGAIDKARLDFNKAYNESDARALAQVIDVNAVWMPPGEPAILGRDKIEARYRSFFARITSKFELKPGDIQPCGNLAFLSGEWSRIDTPKAGGTATVTSGHYLLVLKKQADGTWKISRDIWNQPAKP